MTPLADRRLRVSRLVILVAGLAAGAAGCGDLRRTLGGDAGSATGGRDAGTIGAGGARDAAPTGAGGGGGAPVDAAGGIGGADAGATGAGGRSDASTGTGGAGAGGAGTGGSGSGGRDAGSDARPDGAADSRDAPATGTGGVGLPNSAPCAMNDDCMSGHCVDGYCCNAACTDQCEACDVSTVEGTCAPVPPGDQPHGARTHCNGTGTCAGQCSGTPTGRKACLYPTTTTACRTQACSGSTKTLAAGCDGLGACAAVQTMPCAQGCSGNDCLGACTSDTQCMAAGQGRPYCDTGTCTALKPKGHACTTSAECTSNHCADGYCCDSDCTEQCRSCKEAGSQGTCLYVRGDPRTGGSPARSLCAGSGPCVGSCSGVSPACEFPTTSTLCGNPTSCLMGSLTPMGSCNSNGGCSQPSTPCPTSYCDSATTCGNCVSDAACGMGRYCDAGTCRALKGNGEACTSGADGQCVSGHCENAPSGTGSICCGASCSGSTPRCNAAGTACICDATSCPSPRVCDQRDGTCCTMNAGCSDQCTTFDCEPGCGLPTRKRNCGDTSQTCCRDTCCNNYLFCCMPGYYCSSSC